MDPSYQCTMMTEVIDFPLGGVKTRLMKLQNILIIPTQLSMFQASKDVRQFLVGIYS